MSDRRDRPQDDWIAKLGAALAQADQLAVAARTPGAGTDPVSRAFALPAWPWALSGAGLCLALLALDPSVKEAPAPHPAASPAPQVQGWSSSLTPAVEWPRDVPATGYHGITAALPDVPMPTSDLPPPADEPEPVAPEPATAIRPDPPEPEAVPVATPVSDPPPPPDFVPPQPDWGMAPLDKMPPLFAATHDLPAPRRPAAAAKGVPVDKPRATSPRPAERERTATRRKPAAIPEPGERPGWASKLFGSREG